MPSTTPFFKPFGPLLFGRPARRSLQKIKRVNAGVGSRERLYSTQVTFWAFAAQILSPGTACREMVRRVEAWWRESTGENRGGDRGQSMGQSTYLDKQVR